MEPRWESAVGGGVRVHHTHVHPGHHPPQGLPHPAARPTRHHRGRERGQGAGPAGGRRNHSDTTATPRRHLCDTSLRHLCDTSATPRQVIGVARSCDLILLVVDAGSGKADRHTHHTYTARALTTTHTPPAWCGGEHRTLPQGGPGRQREPLERRATRVE